MFLFLSLSKKKGVNDVIINQYFYKLRLHDVILSIVFKRIVFMSLHLSKLRPCNQNLHI